MDSSTIIHEEQSASRKRKVHQVESPSIYENDVETQKSPLTDSNVMNAVDQSKTFLSTGFSAYAKTNPFLAAASNSSKSGFGSGCISSCTNTVSSSSVFGLFGHGFSSNASSSSSLNENTSKKPIGLTISVSAPPSILPSHTSSVGRENFNMPPPIVVPSPKSPKPNPFSSPSPVHNPFMTIVESKDELWKTMAKDKLSDEEAAKSSALLFGSVPSATKKSRLASYTGSFSNSYFGDCSFALSGEEGKKCDEKDEGKINLLNDDEDVEVNDDQDEATDDNDNLNYDAELSPGKVYTTYALPENVVIVTGEEDDECLFSIRVKLYRLGVKSNIQVAPPKSEEDRKIADQSESKLDINAAEWIEIGVGPMKVLRQKVDVLAMEGDKIENLGDATSVPPEREGNNRIVRLVIRREDKKGGIGTKLLMNTRLDQYVSVAKQTDKMIRLICVNAADTSLPSGGANHKPSQLQTYLIRTKAVKESDELLGLMQTYINGNR